MTPIDLAEVPAATATSPVHVAEPCTIIIFGASGDLTKRKLLPALYELAGQNDLAPRFAIIGFARTQMSDDAFRNTAVQALREEAGDQANEDGLRTFAQTLSYVPGEYHHPEAFQRLSQRIEQLDQQYHLEGNRIFYLATPPDVYPLVIEQLDKAKLAHHPNGKSWVRIVVEKPFGHDLASARQLDHTILEVFDESQVYRIDHYLGKDTVQNLIVLRFGNGVFEPLWNRNYVDCVQITAAETLGVEQRASFYEAAGALRDMIQSHVLQLTSLVAIEAPANFDAVSVRNEKIKVLQSIRPFSPELVWKSVVRGQYGPGQIDGSAVPGYREEPGVKPDSSTETFVALKLQVDNWRWSGVPFYLRSGKRLARPVTEVAIQFKRAPHLVFRGEDVEENSLVLNIQPDEGISLSFGAKSPGSQMRIRPVTMDFRYTQSFGGASRSAYATLINDCIRGDATLFDRADSVEAAWGLVDPILEVWRSASPPPFPNYPAGSSGPRAADDLTSSDGRRWRTLH